MNPGPTILVTGASGYVGSRLLRVLQSDGHHVRCLSRCPEYLHARLAPGTDIVAADVMEPSTLDAAMAGVRTAYYLVHSMGAPGRYDDKDRLGAMNFAQAASAAGVTRILYLGGLGESTSALSTHLQSRQEVGEVLRRYAGATQVVEFRASIVIGSGSVSFEMIRALVERLPIMVTPRWVSVLAQPIAIEDVLAYLTAGLELGAGEHQLFEIGGHDAVSYREIMQEYARQRGLRRLMIPVPVLTPRLSSLWLGLVTPLYARVGRRLIDSLRHPTVVHDDSALRVFPVRPMGVADAIAQAIRNEDRERAESSWTDAVSAAGDPKRWGGHPVRKPARRLAQGAGVRGSEGSVRADPPPGRIPRLVLRQLDVAVAGVD